MTRTADPLPDLAPTPVPRPLDPGALHAQGPAGRIEVRPEEGTTVVRLVGEIDGACREQASHTMGLALMGGMPVVVDATDTTFIDSSGLAFVLQLRMAVQEAGLGLALRDPHRVLLDVLEAVGLGAEHVRVVD